MSSKQNEEYSSENLIRFQFYSHENILRPIKYLSFNSQHKKRFNLKVFVGILIILGKQLYGVLKKN